MAQGKSSSSNNNKLVVIVILVFFLFLGLMAATSGHSASDVGGVASVVISHEHHAGSRPAEQKLVKKNNNNDDVRTQPPEVTPPSTTTLVPKDLPQEDPHEPLDEDPDGQDKYFEGTEAAAEAKLDADLHGGKPLKKNHLTAVIMSYPGSKRHHLLIEIICRLRRWYGLVYEVILVWNGDLAKMPEKVRKMVFEDQYGQATCPTASLPEFGQKGFNSAASVEKWSKVPLLPLKVLPQTLNRIDNRWRIHANISTEAVLNMDDDIKLHRSGAECLFSVFQASPEAIVGIDVRAHVLWSKGGNGPLPAQAFIDNKDRDLAHQDARKGAAFPVGYKARDHSEGYKRYSISLPRALVTNKRFYETYDYLWQKSSSQLRKIVDDTICDDIGFNFVASLSGAHVIYAKATYSPYDESNDAGGLTKMKGMKQKRQRCVNEFTEMVPTWRKMLPPSMLRLTSSSSGGANDGRGKGEDGGGLDVPLKYRQWYVSCSVDG